MSEYQKMKERAAAIQREKDLQLKRELEAKAEREKRLAREEEMRRKEREEASKQARRLELMKANAALNKPDPITSSGPSSTSALNVEYDPFAEDPIISRPLPKPSAKPTSVKPSSRAGSNTSPTSTINDKKGSNNFKNRAASSSSTSTTTKSSRKDRSPSPSSLLLTRKERALKQFVADAKRSSRDNLFSVRALVEGRERDSLGGSTNLKSRGRGETFTPLSIHSNVGSMGDLGGGSKKVAVSGSSAPMGSRFRPSKTGNESEKVTRMSEKARMRKMASSGDLRALCPDRETRDRRTIDEIQRDIKAKRSATASLDTSRSMSGRYGDNSGTVDRKHSRTVSSSGLRDGAPSSIKSGKEVVNGTGSHGRDQNSGRYTSQRRPQHGHDRSSSFSSSDSFSSSSPPPPRSGSGVGGGKRHRSPSPIMRDHASRAQVSAAIAELFGRGRASSRGKYVGRDIDDDSGSEDMEAGLSDLEYEEKRALKIAKLEDERDEREEKRRKEMKERAKREKSRSR